MDGPVATDLKTARSSKSTKTSSNIAQGVARKISSNGYSGSSPSPISSRGRFRKRTARQERPFEMDKIEHNLAKQGVKATEAELADEMQNRPGKSRRKRDSVASSRSTERPGSGKLSGAVSDIEVVDIKQTTIRTWLNGFSTASLPLPLTKSSVNELFTAATEAWRFKLNGKSITYGIVSFPWLDERSNIIFSHDNNDTAFEIMLDEIRRCPTWKAEGRCSVDLEIFA